MTPPGTGSAPGRRAADAAGQDGGAAAGRRHLRRLPGLAGGPRRWAITTFDSGARCFLARYPDPQAWAGLPLAARLAGTRPHLQPLLNFLMLHGHLRPGYDYLLDRKLTVILREAAASPLGPDLKRFLAGAEALGYSVRARTGMASEVAIRMLIQTGRALARADRRRLRRVSGRRSPSGKRGWAVPSSTTIMPFTPPGR